MGQKHPNIPKRLPLKGSLKGSVRATIQGQVGAAEKVLKKKHPNIGRFRKQRVPHSGAEKRFVSGFWGLGLRVWGSRVLGFTGLGV